MNRAEQVYSVKSFGLTVKDFDENSRKVSGYLSSFNTLDSDRDIILPGAFKQSLSMRGPKGADRIAYLRQHDWARQIGKFLELEEDGNGLRFVAQLGRSQEGENALRDYQDGILKEHSIGFQYLKEQMRYDEEQDAYYISELKLWEGSAVTLGANQFTPVIEVAKGENIQSGALKMSQEMEAIRKALKNSKRTDESLENLEMRLRVFQQKYISLIESIQPSDLKEDIATGKEKREGAQSPNPFTQFILKSQ